MFKIDTADAATSLPTPQSIGAHVNGFFTHGDIGTGTPPTRVTHDVLNAIQEEVCHVIASAGLSLDKGDNTQLYEAIQSMISAVTSGSLSAIEDDTTPTLGANLDLDNHKIYDATALELSCANINLNNNVVEIDNDLEVATDNKIKFATGAIDFYAPTFDALLHIDSGGLFFWSGATQQVNLIDADSTMAANSNNRLATQAATKLYLANATLTSERYDFYFSASGPAAGSSTTLTKVMMPYTSDDYQAGELYFYVQNNADFSATVYHSIDLVGWDSSGASATLFTAAVPAGLQWASNITGYVPFKIPPDNTVPCVAFSLVIHASDIISTGNVMVHLTMTRAVHFPY